METINPEHHGREYSMTGIGLLLEFLAGRYGLSVLAWAGALFLFLAFASYTHRYLSAKPKKWKYGLYFSAALFLVLITLPVTGVRFRPVPRKSSPLVDQHQAPQVTQVSPNPMQTSPATSTPAVQAPKTNAPEIHGKREHPKAAKSAAMRVPDIPMRAVPAQPETGPPPAVIVSGSAPLLVIAVDGSSQTTYCNMTPGEQQIYITLIEKYHDERPSGIGINPWVNEQLEAQKEPFRIPVWQPVPSFMDNVTVNAFGSTQVVTEGTAIINNSSVTNGKVGIENNGGYLNVNGTNVSGNDKNIVNNAKQEEKEPAAAKPQP